MMIATTAIALLCFVEPLITQGDLEYVHLEYVRAESLYIEALNASPNNPNVLWRLSRLTISIADVSPKERKEELYRKAETFARRCIASDDSKSDGHTWLAASLGNIAMFEGSETKVRLAREIKQSLICAIELNPTDEVAYSILGSFYRALGGVSWIERQLANLLLGGLPNGGYEEAEGALKKAIALAPNVMRHRYELGMVYREWGRDEEAREELQRAVRLPVSVRSDSTRIAEIRESISELSN